MKLQVYVSEADVYLTRFILRYVNSEGATSSGKITAYQVNRRGRSPPISVNGVCVVADVLIDCLSVYAIVTRMFLMCVIWFEGSEQSKQIVFAPSVEPTFVNVPQNNFVEPFVLNPGSWTVVIEAEGILLVR